MGEGEGGGRDEEGELKRNATLCICWVHALCICNKKILVLLLVLWH